MSVNLNMLSVVPSSSFPLECQREEPSVVAVPEEAGPASPTWASMTLVRNIVIVHLLFPFLLLLGHTCPLFLVCMK